MQDFPSWRLLRSAPQSGAMNMAIDDALLQMVSTGRSLPILRLYRWYPPALTLGYSQSIDAGVDLSACRKEGIDVVRRTTGGRAVLHDYEVTYAVVAPSGPPFGNTVPESYRIIAGVLREALARMGISAELVPGRSHGRQERAVCFTAPAQYELLVDGCKVAGCAQKRLGGTFLQHGSLPLDIDLEQLSRILPGGTGESAEERFHGVGWLNRFAPSPLDIDLVETHLIAAFAANLPISFIDDAPTAEEVALAEKLHAERYGNPAWTTGYGKKLPG